MRPQRKLLTPALGKRASQPGTGTALMIDIMQTIREPLIALDQDLGLVEPIDFWSSSLLRKPCPFAATSAEKGCACNERKKQNY